jgi:2-keto-4-pentenoate hydratase/2-oxohepta-3-ene-1,7-dioic acid hydratase in catechol pathway
MKLASFAAEGRDRIGFVAANGRLIDLAEVLDAAPATMIELIEGGEALLASVRAAAAAHAEQPGSVQGFAADGVTWHPPVRRPSKICCVALNNSTLDEIKISAPSHPAFFIKPWTALVGHGQPIVLRPQYGVTHPEPELAVIIGKQTRRIEPEQGNDAVFGYAIHNDITSVSMRNEDSFHFRYGKPKGDGTYEMVEGHTSYAGRYKGADTFAALGPWIVTRDEIDDPLTLDVRCDIAGENFNEDNTASLTHSVPKVIAFISQHQTLMPGDVISMGTAIHSAGEVARPLTSGDLNRLGGPVTVTISGIGTLSNPVERD